MEVSTVATSLKRMASSLQLMPPPLQFIFDSVGYKPEHLAKYLERERLRSLSDDDIEESPPASLDSKESHEEDFEDSDPLLITHLEVEIVSLILKLWLRRIRLTEQEQGNKQSLVNFEHKIYKSQEEVIKPFNAVLVSSISKDPEEILLLDHYRQSLQVAMRTLSEEKDKANFHIPEEDYERLNMKEVFVCSLLGLELDFLDRIREIPLEDREHRSLCAWIVTFLRDNSECLGKTAMNTKELLYALGFDPFSSAVETILTRAGNVEEHIDACDLAEIFIEDEFKYNPLLSQQSDTVPAFQSDKTNECFPWNDGNNRDCHVNIGHLVTKKSQTLNATRNLMRNFQLADQQHTVLYHGTDYESARDMLTGRGIYLWAGRQKRDFSSGFGFYLTNSLDDALSWALGTTRKPAILVFRVNHAFINKANRLTLSSNEERWRKIVTSFRTNKEIIKTEQTLSSFDVVEGPVAKLCREGTRGTLNNSNLMFEPKPSSYQMCLLSEDIAEEFEQTLHSIFFYDIIFDII